MIEAAEVLEAEAQEMRLLNQEMADEVWPILVIVARFLRERATGTRVKIDWDAWGLE